MWTKPLGSVNRLVSRYSKHWTVTIWLHNHGQSGLFEIELPIKNVALNFYNETLLSHSTQLQKKLGTKALYPHYIPIISPPNHDILWFKTPIIFSQVAAQSGAVWHLAPPVAFRNVTRKDGHGLMPIVPLRGKQVWSCLIPWKSRDMDGHGEILATQLPKDSSFFASQSGIFENRDQVAHPPCEALERGHWTRGTLGD